MERTERNRLKDQEIKGARKELSQIIHMLT